MNKLPSVSRKTWNNDSILILLLLSIKIIQLLKKSRKIKRKGHWHFCLSLCWHSTYENRFAFFSHTHLLTADQAEMIIARGCQLSRLLLDEHQQTKGRK